MEDLGFSGNLGSLQYLSFFSVFTASYSIKLITKCLHWDSVTEGHVLSNFHRLACPETGWKGSAPIVPLARQLQPIVTNDFWSP